MSRYLGILFAPLRLVSWIGSILVSGVTTFLTTTALSGLLAIPWTAVRMGKFVLPLLRLPFRFLRRPAKAFEPERPQERPERPRPSVPPTGSPRARTALPLPPARGPCMSPPAPEPSPLLRYRSPRSLSEMSRPPRLQIQSPRSPLNRSPPGTERDSSASFGSSSPYPPSKRSPSSNPSSRPSSTPS
jgi:hypothetical protein